MASENVGTIAQAYVQIMPSAQGMKGNLASVMGGEAESAGKSAGGKFAGAFGTATKALAGAAVAGFAAAATSAVALGKEALSSYADYEQLTGGIETLFKSSSDTVMQYAADAYKTSGLSANQYMETVTGFSASLIQSAGRGAQQDLDVLEANLDAQYTATKRSLEDQRDAVKSYWDSRIKATKDGAAKESLRAQRDAELKDMKRAHEDQLNMLKQHNKDLLAEAEKANNASVTTEESLAKAAQLANMAITDMSDNANKMGSDMSSIQNAYQGFSKQNFTMLDNLSLGYKGSNEEMERLLADAEALSGIHYDMSSYADVVEAIHVIQTEMGITGTTAKEAASTISGSLAMTKASWANLVTGIADENADLDQLIDDFVESALTAMDNIIPRIGAILEGGGKLLKEGAARLLPVVIDTLIEAAPDLAAAGIQLIITLAGALVTSIPKLVAAAPEIILALYNGFMAGTEDIRAAGTELMEIVKAAVLEKVEAARQWGHDLVTNIDESIRGGIETVRSTATELMESAKDAIWEKVEAAKEWGRDLVQNFIDGLYAKWESLKSTVSSLAQTVKAFFGFSEPTEGPLSDFHTYAPDMIDLWNEGVRSKEGDLRRTLATALDLRPTIMRAAQSEAPVQTAAPGAGGGIINLTALVQLDGETLARKMYRFNLDEIGRHGPSFVTA